MVKQKRAFRLDLMTRLEGEKSTNVFDFNINN